MHVGSPQCAHPMRILSIAKGGYGTLACARFATRNAPSPLPLGQKMMILSDEEERITRRPGERRRELEEVLPEPQDVIVFAVCIVKFTNRETLDIVVV